MPMHSEECYRVVASLPKKSKYVVIEFENK